MVRELVRYMLGPSGVRVLEFYIAHSLPINGPVVLYAALLLVARLNLRRIEDLALKEVEQQLDAAGDDAGAPAGAPSPPIAGPAWPEIVAQGSRFPLVAGSGGWYPRLTTLATVERLLPLQALVDRALAEREAATEGMGTEE